LDGVGIYKYFCSEEYSFNLKCKTFKLCYAEYNEVFMDIEPLIKYLIWIAFFLLASAGVYVLLRQLGVIGV